MAGPPTPADRYAAHVLEARDQARGSDSFRDLVRYDLTPRPHYAFGLLAAADMARFCGVRELVAVELGVADGDGLLALCDLAAEVTRTTGVKFEIVGLDSGEGLPPVGDYRDHPEIWSEGDFTNPDREGLLRKLPENASILWGDVADTVHTLAAKLSPERPLGFIANDLDIYTSTRNSMALLTGPAENYLPVMINYFDDILGGPGRVGSLFRTRWAGQLLAIDEFNALDLPRKIDLIRILKYRRVLSQEQWIEKMYAVHIFDHPLRTASRARPAFSMAEHSADDSLAWPF